MITGYEQLETSQNKGSPAEALSKERKYLPFDIARLDKNFEETAALLDVKTLNAQIYFESYQGRQVNYAIRMSMLKNMWALRSFFTSHSKRAFDLVVSLLMVPFLLPVFLIVALLIKRDSDGPVIFRQRRVGKYCKTFDCYKFRSMYQDAEQRKAELAHLNEAKGVVFKIKDDPRVTRVGRILRKTSLDELPQIFNVIQGNMSLVGPRPPVPAEICDYKFEYMRRLSVVPGITGLQQVVQRTGLEFQRWVELDIRYIQERSLKKDIQIILKTIPAVITGRGAY